MLRCMLLAAVLYDPYRSLPSLMVNDGIIDEAASVTPGQMAWIDRLLPGQRAFFDSPAKHRAYRMRFR